MTPVAPLAATLAGLVLFLAPGLLALALMPAAQRADLEPDEALFLVVGWSVATAAWVALLLAELGRLQLVGAALLVGGTCVLVAVCARRRLSWPLRLGRPRLARTWLPVLALLGLAFALQARPTEYLFGGRDPGTYVNAMALIGRTGGIVYRDPAVLSLPPEYVSLFYREPDKPGEFEWGRFMGFPLERPRSGRVVPEFFHLFPAFGAYLYQSMGVKGALATPPVFGVLATLAVYFAFRPLLGAAGAWLASVLLALNVLQVWFARFPVSEMVSQFLIFAGLSALLRFDAGRGAAWGAAAGTLWGLSLLVRIDSLLIALPLMGWVLWRLAAGRFRLRGLLPLLLPFGLLGLHAGLHAFWFARKYVTSIASRPYWRQPAWVWAVALVVALLLVLAARRWGRAGWQALGGGGGPWVTRARLAAAWGVALLALYAYALRPELSRLAGADGYPAALRLRVEPPSATVLVDGKPAGRAADFDTRAGLRLPAGAHELRLEAAGYTAAQVTVELGNGRTTELRHALGVLPAGTEPGPPQRLDPLVARAPDGLWARLGYRRLAAHDAEALRRFGWFVTPLGLLLALAGLVLCLRRGDGRWLFVLLLTLTFALFYFYKMRVWNDYYFAMRRVVPVTLPCALGLAVLALQRLAGEAGGARVWRRALAGLLALGLGAAFVSQARPLWGYTDWRGAVRFVADLARRFQPEDAVIFEQPRSIHLLALPLWAVHGKQVLELARFNPDPERLNGLVRAWRGRYRHVYFVHTYSTDLCGVFLQRVQDLEFGTLEWERPSDRPPRRPEARALRFSVSRVVPPEELNVPPLDEIDLGGSDDFQVSGFHDKERALDPQAEGGLRSYRWSGRCASIYVPGARPGVELGITASSDKRPADDPAEVRVSLNGVPLGSFEAGPGWSEARFKLPDPLPPGAPVVRLDVREWRPARVLSGSNDVRDLGVAVDRLRLGSTGAPR